MTALAEVENCVLGGVLMLYFILPWILTGDLAGALLLVLLEGSTMLLGTGPSLSVLKRDSRALKTGAACSLGVG